MGEGRKTPILLRRAPLSGRINVLTNYRKSSGTGRPLTVVGDGKHDVTAAFYALLLEELLDPDSADIVSILDGVADRHKITLAEAAQVRAFRNRLASIVTAHNERIETGELGDA
jgi:hypothetical protein